MKSKNFLLSFVVYVFVFYFPLTASAADVSLAWDASASPNIAGYKVYVGTSSRSYGAPIVIGPQTNYSVTGLNTGTYYFTVTAFDAGGNESDYSNEVSQVIASSVSKCSINGDSTVDALDLQLLANVILGTSPTSSRYDLNNDSRVDVLDLQFLNNVILGLRICQ